jgi:hypothetical protein
MIIDPVFYADAINSDMWWAETASGSENFTL